MIKPLQLALLISVGVAAVASAQPAASPAAGFSGMTGKRSITVVDDAGRRTRGSVVRFTPDQLTLDVDGREVSFDREHVAAVYEHGNSVKKGMLLGVATGPALVLASGDTSDYALAAGAFLAVVGLGIGTGIDALIPGRKLIYSRSQPATSARGGGDFTALAAHRPVTVVDESGAEIEGSLVRLTADEVTVRVGGQDRMFARERVAAIFERGDSVKNGATIGFLTGAVLGALAAERNSCGGDFWVASHPCSTNEKVANTIFAAAFLGGISAAIGTGIDALIPGRRVIYRRDKPTATATISIAPSLAPSRVGLVTSVSW